MIRLMFVGDGDRDAAMNPPLVQTLLQAEIEATSGAWARLHKGGRGYDRKLLFAIRQARDEGLQGVVATVDQDKSRGRDRLRDMRAARTRDRETAAPLPAALGCANPHAEAWLLDDEMAVRTVLKLDARIAIPNVRKAQYPKDELTGLHTQSPRAGTPIRAILVEIARNIDPARCPHRNETGFAQFVDEVRDEIGPLARARA